MILPLPRPLSPSPGRLRKTNNLLTGEGMRGRGRSQILRRLKSLVPINHSILSVFFGRLQCVKPLLCLCRLFIPKYSTSVMYGSSIQHEPVSQYLSGHVAFIIRDLHFALSLLYSAQYSASVLSKFSACLAS
jgi:hypothetical protein